MFRNSIFVVFLLAIFIFSSCNTLLNINTIDIEIAVPAKVIMPANYSTAAVRYNNCNVGPNPFFTKYFIANKSFEDTTNIDSVASKIYFQSFTEALDNQFLFDTVVKIAPFDYSDFYVTDSFNLAGFFKNDSSILAETPRSKFAFPGLALLINTYPQTFSHTKKQKIIDPEFGLYTKNELQQIADTTGVDLLFSLDYYAALDVIKEYHYFEFVYIYSYWNIYDLQKNELLFFYEKMDTISWEAHKNTFEELGDSNDAFSVGLPQREDAVFTAAEIAGSNFAEFLFPHWIAVKRMYYKSGNVDLKKTEKLIEQGEWLKAAEIWKSNIANKNKNIAAKSMFNLALANEMEGNIEGAMDWVVKSFFLLGQKNEIHHKNCMEYINLLGQRKLDLKNIDAQLNVNNSNIP